MIGRIKRVVAREYGMGVEEMDSRTREQPVSDARMMAMHLVYRKCDIGMNEIGEAFKRDRTTVSYAVKKIEDLVQFDRTTRLHYERIKTELEK